eukprot:TRINITY_DN2152_c0_g4_i1.p1 TRINITY_DN2152_c0_g4~~TRINITY_DN2152_c0_g4_i1.p1  ORF type:complete len:693 (-),score=189.18 TRINITY_DN2152_c0_g4_i1:54-2132(-)
MDNYLFFRLGAGANFDKKRFSSDVKIFHKKPEDKPNQPTQASPLDFFGKKQTTTTKTNSTTNSNNSGNSGNSNNVKKEENKKDKRKKGKKGKVELSMKQEPKEEEHQTPAVKEEQEEQEQEGLKEEDELDTASESEEDEEMNGNNRKRKFINSTGDVSFFSTSNTLTHEEKVEKKRKTLQKKEQKEMEKKERERLDRIEKIRSDFTISVDGDYAPEPIENFQDLQKDYKMRSYLLKNIESSGYAEPTPIQMQCIPSMLSVHDVIAIAPTGSGKTAAYVIPILHLLNEPSKEGVRAIMLGPTKELTQQMHRHVEKLSKGKPFKICLLTKKSTSSLQSNQKFDVIIATPSGLVSLIRRNIFSFNRVLRLVFDEADSLFDTTFLKQVDEIITACRNPSLRVSLFSATMHPDVQHLAKTVMKEPLTITVGTTNAAPDTVEQRLNFVGSEEGKLLAIRQLFVGGVKPPVLIFVQSKERADELFRELVYDGIFVDVIHSDRTEAQRDVIIEKFRSGALWVLIATDLVSRGMDFKGLSLVINFDFPRSMTEYIHRVGRTGRAGRPGKAVTLFTESDIPLLKRVAPIMKTTGCEVPDWILAEESEQESTDISTRVKIKRDSITPKEMKKRRKGLKNKSKLKKESGEKKENGEKKVKKEQKDSGNKQDQKVNNDKSKNKDSKLLKKKKKVKPATPKTEAKE